jgi:signal transduction histidine kinase
MMLLAFIGSISFSQIGGTVQQRDSLKHELAIAKDDTSRVLVMAKLADAYSVNHSDTAGEYGNMAQALAQKIQFPRGELTALNALSNIFQIQGDYPKSLQCAYRGLQIAEEKNYVFEAAGCYEWIGAAYWFLADYAKSVDFYKRSYALLKTTINNPDTAESIKFALVSIIQAYDDWNYLDSAHHYLLQYFNTAQNNDLWYPNALYLLGDYLFKRGNRDTAFDYVREGIARAAANGDYFTQAEACATISRFFKIIQQPDSSIYYAKKGFAAANSGGYEFGAYKNCKLLAEEYEQLNLQEALRYRKIYDSVNESMYGQKKVQDLQKILAEEQHRQQQIQEEQIKKEDRLKQYGFIAGLAIVLLIAFILYRNNLQKKKANVLLQHQKDKVETTLSELKSTQAQLIQSEKMASLGELTAGIAHEIQNPLNFVNNFSEVNAEMIDELQTELKSGNVDEAMNISNDIKENEQKINYHGKRADGIVKGMLQHSRASSGQRELTDINKLADEYLRLSYHGMRARDKSFNAEFKTDFDESIGKINVVPQDIGRVLLNLFNNAFYAVSKPPNPLKGSNDYEPTVSISTKRLDGKILISVKDNGPGIPQNIVDKIFQPFFTTKPTGQGTGLGLSLAYDIIKAHGGEIRVETKEGEGTTFTIQLPN